jgi:hypothetical protein
MKFCLTSFVRVCGATLVVTCLAAAQSTAVHTTDSVTPQNGGGGSQAFTFVFSSSAGYQDVLTAGPHILFSDGGSSGTDYCWLAIGQGGMALAQDNLQSAWPAVAFGANAVVQNSQCLVSGAGSSLSFSGNTVTATIAITFRPAWTGMKTIYSNFNSSNQGYMPAGTYNVTATAPDFTVAVSPASQSIQSGKSTTYTVTVTPLNSFNQNVLLSFTGSPSVGSNANVSGSFSPSLIPPGGGASTLTVISASSTPASTWQLSVTGTSSSWIHSALPVQLSVTGAAPPPPPTRTTDSVSPQNGSGSAQVFTFMFSDSASYNDLITGKYHLLINTSPSRTNSCWFLLESTGLYLAPDDPVQPWYFVSYGSTRTASNSQCRVSGVGTNISGASNNLTLSLSLTFTPAYTGAKNVYTDVNASNPDYIAAATYTVQ